MARAATKRNQRAKAAASSRSQHLATESRAARRGHPEWEQDLFFGRLRRNAKWVFAFLAVVFAGSFVFLGVGSGGSALTDFLNGNIHLFGSGGGPTVESVQKKLAKDPGSAKLRLQYAQLLSKDNRYDESIAAYRRYLALRPRDATALQELANVYSSKVTALQREVRTPPTPPLAALTAVQPISSNTALGTALATLAPPALGSTLLQQGESALLQKDLDHVIRQHVGVYERMAALNPGDSSSFLAAADAAAKDGDTALEISLYQKFLTKYPTDPLAPDIRRTIKKLQKQAASGQTRQPYPTPARPSIPTG